MNEATQIASDAEIEHGSIMLIAQERGVSYERAREIRGMALMAVQYHVRRLAKAKGAPEKA